MTGINFDRCFHDIAMEYAKRNLESKISSNKLSIENLEECVSCIYESYINAVSYLRSEEDS